MAEQMIAAPKNFTKNGEVPPQAEFQRHQNRPFDNSLHAWCKTLASAAFQVRMQVPNWVLLNRMLTLLLGLCNTLDPKNSTPLDVVRPYAKDFVLGQRGDFISLMRKYLQGALVNAPYRCPTNYVRLCKKPGRENWKRSTPTCATVHA